MSESEEDPELIERLAGEAEVIAQLPVSGGAWAFLEPLAESGLAAAWTAVDPLLRRCWVQEWIHSNRSQLSADGYDRETVLAELERDEPRHPLWPAFCRVYDRGLDRVLGDVKPRDRGLGTRARVVGPDIEIVYLHDRSKLPGGVWEPGTYARVHPILMRWSPDVGPNGAWRVLNLNTEVVPEPGWPPRLY